MHKPRLDSLADGIFAIVMTLLVIDIKVPHIAGTVTNTALWDALKEIGPLFASYVLAFLVLSTFWVAHHFIVTMYAVNLTRRLAYLNIPFFMLIALTPFSSHLLGSYPETQVAVAVFGINVILIGLVLLAIINYVDKSNEIENPVFSRSDIRYGYIRVIFPVISALLAIAISFYSVSLSIIIFVSTVLISIIPGTLSLINRMLNQIMKRVESGTNRTGSPLDQKSRD